MAFTLAVFCAAINGRELLNASRFNFLIDTYSGIVVFSPPEYVVRSGDRILTVNGVPAAEIDLTGGFGTARQELFSLVLSREGDLVSVMVPVEQPTFWLLRLSDWWILITAYLFLASGILFHYFHAPNESNLSSVYLIVSTSLGLLITGMFSRETFVSDFSIYSVWFLFPAVAHLQVLFSRTTPSLRIWRFLLAGYLFAFLGYLLSISQTVFPDIWESAWGIKVSMWLGVWIIPIWSIGWSVTTIWFVATLYRRVTDKERQREIGLVASGTIMSFAPALILSLIPGTLFNRTILPFQVSFIALAIAPLSYAYAIQQYRFIRLERYVSRAATIILSLLIAGVLYVAVTESIRVFLSPALTGGLAVTYATVLLPALAFEPIRRVIQRLFDWLTYGGWYDFQSVITRVSATLTTTPSIHHFTRILIETMQQAMRVDWAGILIQEPGRQILKSATVVGNKEIINLFQDLQVSTDGYFVQRIFASPHPLLYEQLQQEIEGTDVRDDHRFLNEAQRKSVHLFVPLYVGAHHAILLLGAKQSREPYNKSDFSILEVTARQASVAFANAVLVDELKEKIRENEQYQRQIVHARDEEGKRIAREIHDSLIQSLVAFKYQLADVQSNLDLHPTSVKMNLGISQLQDQLAGLIQEARQICQELRPETIDLGLVPSLRSLLNQFKEDNATTVTFTVASDIQEPQEDITICLMRCLQEALKNIEKHARASQVAVTLSQQNNRIRIFVEDNGVGFTVPQRLGSLMDDYHFGIIGMRERVELLGGVFQVESQPEAGATFIFEIPLDGYKF